MYFRIVTYIHRVCEILVRIDDGFVEPVQIDRLVFAAAVHRLKTKTVKRISKID